LPISIPKTAIVIFNHGAFGGAPKRFTHLFTYLNKKYPGKFYYIINRHIFAQLKDVFKNFDFTRVMTVDLPGTANLAVKNKELDRTCFYADDVTDPMEVDKNASYPRKVYWYYKNMFRQKKLYNMIERIRDEHDIKVFIGIFAGVMPLVFYFNQNPRKAAVIYSDMDSWFVDVHRDMKRLWYRKYYSFNYAFENADLVEFLSPYLLEGIRKLGIKIEDSRSAVAPCSFADYSTCSVGDKSNFEVSFASRMEPNKNPVMFLEAVRQIHNEFPNIKFHMLGEGMLVHEIENFINSNNLGNVVDFRFHTNPPEIFANTSVFVSLQTNTNYPSQSVLEAMACGNAIIASNVGDTNLFINESNGILINLNIDELTAALKKLITTPGLATSLGNAGREFVIKNHTIEKMADYYIELIEMVDKLLFLR